ncbi:MAG: tetratricopeptide repeat protein [Elusimicrobiales bacterium]
MNSKIIAAFAFSLFGAPTDAAAQAGGGEGEYLLAAKGADWALAFNTELFGLAPLESVPYGNGANQRMKTDISPEGLMLSAFIERLTPAQAAKIKTSAGCRNLYWEKLKSFPIPAQNLKRMEYRGMSLLQADYEQVKEDGVFTQRSVHAYLFNPGYCADVHISKSDYQSGDAPLLNKFLNRIRLVKNYRPQPAGEGEQPPGGHAPRPGGSGTQLQETLQAGIMAYMSGDYKKAADNMGRVLESEKKTRTLSERTLIHVIDNLGESYGRLGDFKKAHETLDYGISLFPAQTQLNYNKACAYGEEGELDKAIAELEKAYANNPARKPYLPNPATDSSFAKFRSEPKFKEFLRRNGK